MHPPKPAPPREVPMADRFLKKYINHPQTTCTHPVKWRLEIPSRFGGVLGQRTSTVGQMARERLDSTYFHSVNWHLEIPSRLGGVRRQRSPRQTCDGQTDIL